MASCFLWLWRGEWHSCIFAFGEPIKLWSFWWLTLFLSKTAETLETLETLSWLIPLFVLFTPEQEFLILLLGLTPTDSLIGFKYEAKSEFLTFLLSTETLQLSGFFVFFDVFEFKKLDYTIEVTEMSVLVDILLSLWLEFELNWRGKDF